MSEAHDRHHAEQRRKRREASRQQRTGGKKSQWGEDQRHTGGRGRPHIEADDPSAYHVYGLHPVRHALLNPARRKSVLHVTANALQRLDLEGRIPREVEIREAQPKALDRLVGSDAVHQGCVLAVEPLQPRTLQELADSDLLLVLDQVTDPHNVGAIMRSAVAMGAGALITTSRHSPAETGVLAKSASGALDLIDHIEVRNLAETLESLHGLGFATIGLDSEGPQGLEETVAGHHRMALVLGSEGKGLRRKTRDTCTALARIDMPGAIRSLNVSNAAILALYIARRQLG
ncbi:TrmH family RNA methyltransferase [Salaquimonas pukyongi]|uniref:TrmH family RNA methyltransferase n=1 Tax=Salaquimonas pukyongi TaxID=2712698 RepID=UPI00096BB73D|nr:RNA methyltransferase [Salaquimonas pukyongi]